MTLRALAIFLTGLLPAVPCPASEVVDRFEEALAHFRGAEYREALEIISSIEKEQPDRVMFGDENLYNFKGSCLTALRYFQHARKEFAKALAAQPDSFDMKYNLAEMDFLQEHFVAARDQFEALKETDRGRVYSDFLDFKIGMCRLMEGEKARVLEDLEIRGRDTPIHIFLTTAIALREEEQDKAEVLLLLAREEVESEMFSLYEDSLIECGLINPPSLPGETESQLRRPVTLGTDRLHPKSRSEAAGDPIEEEEIGGRAKSS